MSIIGSDNRYSSAASRIRKVEKGQKMTTKDARRLWLAVALVATANMGARADEVDNCVTE